MKHFAAVSRTEQERNNMAKRWLAILFSLGFVAGNVHAVPMVLSGRFDDSANSALVGSDLGTALFGDDGEIANNVALYSLNVPIAGTVSFDSNGFAAGGADPYITVFQGSGGSATFLESNFAQAFSIGGDFLISALLPVGDYMIALGVFANMSMAENLGTGTLADGFTGLGVPGLLGNYYYELVVTKPDGPVVPAPEPSSLMLFTMAGATVLIVRKKRRRR